MIPAGRNVSIERETFPKILAEGKQMYAYTTDDYWIDLGRPEHYLSRPPRYPERQDAARTAADPRTRDHRPGNPSPRSCGGDPGSDPAREPNLVPPVHFDDGVHLAPTATSGRTSSSAKACSIGDRGDVRESVLWEEVEIGDGA